MFNETPALIGLAVLSTGIFMMLMAAINGQYKKAGSSINGGNAKEKAEDSDNRA